MYGGRWGGGEMLLGEQGIEGAERIVDAARFGIAAWRERGRNFGFVGLRGAWLAERGIRSTIAQHWRQWFYIIGRFGSEMELSESGVILILFLGWRLGGDTPPFFGKRGANIENKGRG